MAEATHVLHGRGDSELLAFLCGWHAAAVFVRADFRAAVSDLVGTRVQCQLCTSEST